MLTINTVDCASCTTIAALLADIDERLQALACTLYNNIAYSMNVPIKGWVINDLLNYKRILIARSFNPDYASCFTLEQIADRVKILKYK